jgi:hypothetical protein
MELATSAFSTQMVSMTSHPILMQSTVAPSGQHFPEDEDFGNFPRKDDEGVCWNPEGVNKAEDF